MDILYLIVPCFNEEAILGLTQSALKKKMSSLISEDKISKKSKILFIDDGSTDNTLPMIRQANQSESIFSYLSFSRNFGHQSALVAGLFFAVEQGADITISIDADLQQDIDAVDSFLEKYQEGADIVYGVRDSRDTDSFFKKFTASCFYNFMGLLGCRIIKNHADYRLMSAKAVNALKEYKEVNLFLRGLVPLVGFRSDVVYFHVSDRQAGKSKYTAKKMVNFALDGITSLSMKPVRWITLIGITVFVLSIAMVAVYLAANLAGATVSGWTSIIISIWALGGLQLMAVGIVGEYVGKTYMESKGRPRYIVKEYRDANDSQLEKN